MSNELITSTVLPTIFENELDPAQRESLLLLDSDLVESDEETDNYNEDPSDYMDGGNELTSDQPSDEESSANEELSADKESSADEESSSGTNDVRDARADDQSKGGDGQIIRGRGRGGRGRGRGGRGRGSGGRGRGRGGRGRGRGGRGTASAGKHDGRPPPWEWSCDYNDDSTVSAPPPFNEPFGPSLEAQACEEPEEFFSLLFPDELIQLIIDNTILYADQNGVPISFSFDDIRAYIGLNIAMGIVGLPEISDYWSREPILRSPWFASVMPRNKFYAISRFLHFVDKQAAPSRNDDNYDKLWKIRPIVKFVQERAQKMYVPGEHISIDESMIGTKARLGFIQYLPKKPTKWGVKVWVCAEANTGYVYRFEIYTGKSELSPNGLAYDVVMRLLEGLLDSGRTLYCDNFYTGPILFADLYTCATYATGTCRSNRKEFPSEVVHENLQKGGSIFRYHGPLTACKWVDKRDVYVLSTLMRSETEQVERRGGNGEKETVTKPTIVTDYNRHMGGVDLADQCMVYYAVGRKSMKWYKRIFWRLIEQTIVNAYILFKQIRGINPKQYPQKLFRMDLAHALTTAAIRNRIGQGRPSLAVNFVRLQGKHFGRIHEDRRGRCVVCAYKRKGPYSKKRKDKKTKNYCSKCSVFLCHGTCFQRFHTLFKY